MSDDLTKIKKWLFNYDKIEEIAKTENGIHIEELADNSSNLALQVAGNEILVDTSNIKKIKLNLMLLLRIDSEDDLQRAENMGLLSDFQNWVDSKNRSHDFPTLSGKTITKVYTANGITYEVDDNGIITNYNIQLFIEYYRFITGG